MTALYGRQRAAKLQVGVLIEREARAPTISDNRKNMVEPCRNQLSTTDTGLISVTHAEEN